MKKRIKSSILMLTIIISLFSSFVALANEGLSVIPSRSGNDSKAWKYFNEDNTKLINQWKKVNEDWYYFGEDGISKQSTWCKIDSKWYYFDSFSKMLHDTITPDGHTLGADGVWIPVGDETAPVQETTTNN